MNRSKLLEMIDVAHGRGLEIGPLTRPLVTRDMGPIEYIDRASREELQSWHAANDAVDIEKIVDVDHIWGDQSLIDCVGGHRAYTYLLAAHVIEHVPDLFGWLREIAAVLADGGLATFVVPDKRYTFDVRRRPSSAADLVDAYVRGLRRPDARQIFDHFYNFQDLRAEPATRSVPDDADANRRARELLELCQSSRRDGDYVDTHCWVFTPRSLAQALDLGSGLGLLPFEIARLEATDVGANEFLLSLRRLPEGSPPDAQRAAFVSSLHRLSLPEEEEHGVASDLDVLTARANAAIVRAAAMEASTSWRLTSPLRKATTLMRALKQRAGR